jgi:hypothetical protein
MMKLITMDDYKLTNIDLRTGYFTIRLRDGNEYIVYRGGRKQPDYIVIDGEKVPLADDVKKAHLSEVGVYQRSGI